MPLERVCEMKFRYDVPPQPLWGCLLDIMTRLSNMTISEYIPTSIVDPSERTERLRQHMTIVSVNPEEKVLKQRFTAQVFYGGYKLNTSTTRVKLIFRSGDTRPRSLVECSIEYEKDGSDLEDLNVVEIMKFQLNQIAHNAGFWAVHTEPTLK